MRHFLDIADFTKNDLLQLVTSSHAMKLAIKADKPATLHDYRHKTLIGIFEKPSTRTRISFFMAMNYLGGKFLYLSGGEMQLGHGESLSDTAKVLSVLGHGIMVRTYAHKTLCTIADHATVPVINGLTDDSHPCQIMAGLLTLWEEFGSFDDISLAWVGDGNNTCQSWMEAASILNIPMVVACPQGYEPKSLPKNIQLTHDAKDAARGKKVIITDTWVSMNHTDRAVRLKDFHDFTVDKELFALADKNAILSHCLPAHRGEEVTADIIDGPHSRVWGEAENRIFAQMAIIDFLLFPRGKK